MCTFVYTFVHISPKIGSGALSQFSMESVNNQRCRSHELGQELANRFFEKLPIVNISRFLGLTVSVATTLLCHHREKAGLDGTYVSGVCSLKTLPVDIEICILYTLHVSEIFFFCFSFNHVKMSHF